MTPPPPVKKDSIDRFIEASLALFPGVDAETEGLADRLYKISKHLKRQTERTVARFGLNTGEFQTLLKLRIAPEQTQSAGDLAELLDLSTGAMTNRLDGLEEAGFVTRERDASDRRSVLVTMTPKGSDVLLTAVEAASKEEAAALSALSEPQRRQLNHLLRTLLLAAEASGADAEHA
jgi:DNA-binding MarR family transcriptional regulator